MEGFKSKTCYICKCNKDIQNFVKFKQKRVEYCKDCSELHHKERKRLYSIKYREDHKEELKIYRENNKEYMKNYKEKNRELLNKKAREKYKENPKKFNDRNKAYLAKNKNARIAANLRSRLNKALKGETKKKKTLELLGCSSEEYVKYLEEKFEEGMSWENYGRKSGKDRWWEIDHTIPLSKYNLKDENQLAEATNYLNTKPMWQKENIKKSNNLDEKSIDKLSVYQTEEYTNKLKNELEEKKLKENSSTFDLLTEKYLNKNIQFKFLPFELKLKYFKSYLNSINSVISDLTHSPDIPFEKSSISILCNFDCKCTTKSVISKIIKKKFFCNNISQLDNQNFVQFLQINSLSVKSDFINYLSNKINSTKSKICDNCNIDQPICYFQKSLKYMYGYSNSCNNCKTKNNSKPIHILSVNERLDYIKKIISENTGKLISKEYLNRDSVITIKCKHNHIWDTKANNILKGHWCPECNKNNPYTKKINESRSDKLTNYYNTETGKMNKKLAHKKRSLTMKLKNDELKKKITNKICSQCDVNKEITYFNKRKNSKDGYNGICKECSNINRKKYK